MKRFMLAIVFGVVMCSGVSMAQMPRGNYGASSSPQYHYATPAPSPSHHHHATPAPPPSHHHHATPAPRYRYVESSPSYYPRSNVYINAGRYGGGFGISGPGYYFNAGSYGGSFGFSGPGFNLNFSF